MIFTFWIGSIFLSRLDNLNSKSLSFQIIEDVLLWAVSRLSLSLVKGPRSIKSFSITVIPSLVFVGRVVSVCATSPGMMMVYYCYWLLTSVGAIDSDWSQKVTSKNALYAENDDGLIDETGYPGIYLPLIGNGYFSHAKGVRSDEFYISGVFNNESEAPTHRARIPATFSITIDDTETTGVLLDMKEGTYYRRGRSKLSSNISYELKWYAHMKHRSLYLMELIVDLSLSSDSSVTFNLTQNTGPPSSDISFTASKTKIGGHILDVQCGETIIPETVSSGPVSVCLVSTPVPKSITVNKHQSGEIFTFLTSFCTSLEEPSEYVLSRAVQHFEEASHRQLLSLSPSPSPLHLEHIHSWASLWQSGVEVIGSDRDDVAIAINCSLFAILSSVRSDWHHGLAPGGLTNYYNGHSFWDTETWMYPPLLLLQPDMARSLMQYRFDRLDGAYAKARSYDPPYAGAMFPWESAFSGVETCPLWAPTGLREQHISADIALAVWQYYSVTGDKKWLESTGMPILIGIADFYISRAVFDEGGITAHIYGVIPPDEYVENCNDSSYTNFAAAQALRFAVYGAQDLALELDNSVEYLALADALVILSNTTLGIHAEYDGYAGQLIKQADVVLLHYPW
jgi:protein-glucosylgalactosylhydroxylysine glucosidase